jgi:hypothetical protein
MIVFCPGIARYGVSPPRASEGLNLKFPFMKTSLVLVLFGFAAVYSLAALGVRFGLVPTHFLTNTTRQK